MTHSRRLASLSSTVLFAAVIAIAPNAGAQKYPDHPIKLIVPVPPGVGVVDKRESGVDLAAQPLAQSKGQPHISGRLLSTYATAEQHRFFAEGQGRVTTLIHGPAQRHSNEEWRRVVCC